jgi:hypothetical protein
MKCCELGSNIKTRSPKCKKKKNCEKHEACNIADAPPYSLSCYEHFISILGGTKKNEWCNW